MRETKEVTHNGLTKKLLITERAKGNDTGMVYEIAFDIMGNCFLLVNGEVNKSFLTFDNAQDYIKGKEDVTWDYTEQ